MRIKLTSVFVSDQEKALQFYTEVLGFAKKTDIPMGNDRWLTVVSAEGPSDVELLLEPMGFDPARTYQKARFLTRAFHARRLTWMTLRKSMRGSINWACASKRSLP